MTWKQEKECSTSGFTKEYEWYGNIQGEIIVNKNKNNNKILLFCSKLVDAKTCAVKFWNVTCCFRLVERLD